MDPRDVETDRQAVLRGARHLAAAIVDARGIVLEWTPGAARLLGYPRTDIVGRPLGTLLDPDVPPDVWDRLLAGIGGAIDVVMRHRAGHPVTVELLCSVRAGADGTPLRLVVATGLPVERDMEETLKSWALDQVPVIGAIFDTDARYLHLNDYARRLWDIPADRLLGRTVLEDRPEGSTDEFLESILGALRTGEASVYEAKQERGLRTRSWAIHNTPLKDPAGEVRGVYTLGIETSRELAARRRLDLLNRASATIGSTLDTRTTARELARVVVPELADFVTVDLLDSVLADEEPFREPEGPAVLRRLAESSVLEGTPESVLKPGDTETYDEHSPNANALATGRSFITTIVGDPRVDQWAGLHAERSSRGSSSASTPAWWCRCAPGAAPSGWSASTATSGRTTSTATTCCSPRRSPRGARSAWTTRSATPASASRPSPSSTACSRTTCPRRRPSRWRAAICRRMCGAVWAGTGSM